MRISLVKVDRRKVFLKGRLTSVDGETLYSEAEALYIIDRSMKKLKLGEEMVDAFD